MIALVQSAMDIRCVVVVVVWNILWCQNVRCVVVCNILGQAVQDVRCCPPSNILCCQDVHCAVVRNIKQPQNSCPFMFGGVNIFTNHNTTDSISFEVSKSWAYNRIGGGGCSYYPQE
jgi:hypothetical protein